MCHSGPLHAAVAFAGTVGLSEMSRWRGRAGEGQDRRRDTGKTVSCQVRAAVEGAYD